MKMNLFRYSLAAIIFLQCGKIQTVSCENILFYFGLTGFSHVNSIYPLVEALADKGHNATILTPFPTKRTPKPGVNITTIVSNELLQLFAPTWDEDADLIQERLMNTQDLFWVPLVPLAIEACRIILTSPTTSPIVYNSRFDLVIYDASLNDCAVALAHYKYNTPYISFSPVPVIGYYHDTFGIPLETSALSDLMSADVPPLTLYQKVKSMFESLKWVFDRKIWYYPALEEMLQAKLQLQERPSLATLNAETSLVFLNTHYTTDHARALPPNFIPVAGMQITDKRNPLPDDIKEFLADSTGHDYLGFVYVSFGTAVRISKTNTEVRRKLFNAMGNSTSLKFIWKWEGNVPDNAPRNIYFSNWLPQLDLLAHKDVKAVVGHAGINGIHEAVHFGIPMILFPIFADQDFNANSLESKGLAIKMEFRTFAQNELEHALAQVATNQVLRRNAQLASQQFRDRPMSPVDTALWWTEYVMRHKNTISLKSATRFQTWYERRFLDVWVAIFLVLQLSIWMAVTLVFKAYKILNSSSCKASTKNYDSKKVHMTNQQLAKVAVSAIAAAAAFVENIFIAATGKQLSLETFIPLIGLIIAFCVCTCGFIEELLFTDIKVNTAPYAFY